MIGTNIFLARGLLAMACTMSLLGLPSPLRAASDELLQKAIYTEETVGNLDEAIKLYVQVIDSAKVADHTAAQAQYRLGLCYQKQKKSTEAAAAFQTVIDKYRDEKELVKLAQKKIAEDVALLPAPWNDGESLHYTMRLANKLRVGTMIYRVQSSKHEGVDVWECSTRGLISLNGTNSFSRVLCDKDKFVPLVSHWRHDVLGVADAQYKGPQVTIRLKGKDKPVTIEELTGSWDNEQAFQLFRRLPLRVGQKLNLQIVSTLTATKASLKADVTGKETLEVPAGKFECFKLVLEIGQTFWVADDVQRYIIRIDAGGVEAELTRIEKRRIDSPTTVQFEGMSLTLPPGWDYDVGDGEPTKKIRRLNLLDPTGVAFASIDVGPIASLKEEQRSSVRAWAETFSAELSEQLSAFKLREPGIIERQIAGESGRSVVGDYKKDTSEMSLWGAGFFRGDQAVSFRVMAPREAIETMRPGIDGILDSIQMK